jgi:hypothetical protein
MMNNPTDGGKDGKDGTQTGNAGNEGKDEKDCSKVCSKKATGNMDCEAECNGCFGGDGNCDLK